MFEAPCSWRVGEERHLLLPPRAVSLGRVARREATESGRARLREVGRRPGSVHPDHLPALQGAAAVSDLQAPSKSEQSCSCLLTRASNQMRFRTATSKKACTATVCGLSQVARNVGWLQ